MLRFLLSSFLVFYSFLVQASDIAIVTLVVGDSYKQAVQIGIDNKQRYAQMHGYDFICVEEHLDKTRPIAWSKIPAILKAMENPAYKWIFWTDADSLIMNLSKSLEELIDEKYDFILSKAWNGINTGEFFIKNNEWGRQLLVDAYARAECIYHPWWEQQALIEEFAVKPSLLEHTKFIPSRLINCFPKEIVPIGLDDYIFHQGDFIVHFAGIHDLIELQKLFRHYQRRVVKHP